MQTGYVKSRNNQKFIWDTFENEGTVYMYYGGVRCPHNKSYTEKP